LDDVNKGDLALTKQTLKISKSTKKVLNSNFSNTNLTALSSKNLNSVKNATNPTNNHKNDKKEEDSTYNFKVDINRKSTTTSKAVNTKETINNLEPISKKILKETKTEKKITRDKTPFIKDKPKESEKTLNKTTVNTNFNDNNTININTLFKSHKNSDFTINEENGSKSLANNNNVNTRKSFSKKSIKNENGNANGNGHSDGKSLIRTKTEKVIVSNFNPTDNAMENLAMDKSKKIIKKEKTEAILNKNSSVSVSKLKQNIGCKDITVKSEDNKKDAMNEKNLEIKILENGEPIGNSNSNENQNKAYEEENLLVVAEKNILITPKITKPDVKIVSLYFKKIKNLAFKNISQ
jgi:hypothetical protein